MNEFMIGAHGRDFVFMRLVPQRLTREQAISLVAWLVAMADPIGDDFKKKLEEVTSS